MARFTELLPEDIPAFPESLQMPRADGGFDTLELCTVGVRRGFLVDLYAVGLYVDPDRAREHLAPWRGQDPATLASDPAFREALLDPGLPRAVRYDMALDFATEDIRSNRIGVLTTARAAGTGREAEALVALESFAACFGGELEAGCEIVARWKPGASPDDGSMVAYINGEEVLTISQPDLIWAVFWSLLEEEHGIDGLLERLTEHMAGLLAP